MVTNTFGLKMDGLGAVSQSLEEYGWNGLQYNELFYNVRTGKVWVIKQIAVNHTAETIYNNPSVIKIGNVTSKLSEQQLAIKVYRGMLKHGRITRA
jgi:hypothetical protein